MKIDQYLRKESTKSDRKSSLAEIFVRIRSENISTPKNKRRGNVFCSRTQKGRKHEDIINFTGLMFIDIDKCTDHKKVKEFFISLEHTVASWYSSSGVNVHALIKIPVSNSVEQYKRRFEAFMFLVKPIVEEFATIDRITSNPTQLAFESYDPDIYINKDPVPFTLIMPKPKKRSAPVAISSPTTGREDWVVKWIHNKITGICAPGYSQLLAYAKTLGGYVSGGYIDRDVAEAHLLRAIGNNPYFNSSESSGTIKTYTKGGLSALENGLLYPIAW